MKAKSISKICILAAAALLTTVGISAQTGQPYFNVMDPAYGAKCNGSTDDSSSIQNAINAAMATGGTVVIPDGKTCVVASQLNMSRNGSTFAVGVALVGGLAGSNKSRFGGAGNTGPQLLFTGAPATLISARSSLGVSIDRLAIVATNPLFSGTVIDLSHDPTDVRCGGSPCDTSSFVLSNTGISASDASAAIVLSMDKTIDSVVNNSIFIGGSVQIRGASGSGSYSNANRILNSTFEGGARVSTFIQNPSQAWVIQGNTFEVNSLPIQTIGVTAGFLSGDGIVFTGNWDGDMVETAAFTKYTLTGSGWLIAANHIEGNDPNVTVFSLPSWMSNFTVTGNNLCGGTFGTVFSIGSTAHVNINMPGCAGTYSTFMSGTPSSGIVADPVSTKIYGPVSVFGPLSKPMGSFKIDHPLDPANKYLSHSFVESPDMMNIYNGVAILDSRGTAAVRLPAYFEALNKDFRYQLTCIGGPAQIYVAREIRGNSFLIAGGKPGMKVSWQVTGIRHHAYADAHRLEVEEEKPVDERGHYLYPALFDGDKKDAGSSSSKPAERKARPDHPSHP